MDIKKIKELGKWLDDDLVEMEIDQSIISICKAEIIRQYAIIPYKRTENTICLATADERNLKRAVVLQKILGMKVSIMFTHLANIAMAMAKYYQILNYRSDTLSIEDVGEEVAVQEEEDEEESALIARTNELFVLALDRGATDIHILPNDKKLTVYFKLNGELVDFSNFVHQTLIAKRNDTSRLALRIKAMCDPRLQTSANMPQDGSLLFTYGKRKVDCRVSVIPSIRGEGVVIRLMNEKESFKDLDKVGYSPETLFDIRRVLARPGGLFIVTGPVNSGKSTSLYACLNTYDFKKKSVITIEDPVEQKNEEILQVQTRYADDERNKLTFAKVLRAALRHDPNIALIGEIRDVETAEIAIRASLTGHKVFSTLHNKNVISTIDRLMNMGADKKLLLSELSCVISQRLISTVCAECSNDYQARVEDVHLLNDELRKKLLGKTLKRAGREACPYCNGTGYAGMQVIEECLVITNDIRDFLSSAYTLRELNNFLEGKNFISMQARALNLVLDGKTTIEKYLSTMPDEG